MEWKARVLGYDHDGVRLAQIAAIRPRLDLDHVQLGRHRKRRVQIRVLAS